MDQIDWRTSNDGLEEEASVEFAIEDQGESMTVQSGKDDADINVIVRRFGIGDQMPRPLSVPQFGDFSGVADYQEALEQLRVADEAFMDLPADLRKRFENDPGQLWLFVQDPANLDEARKLGIVEPLPVEAAPMRVQVVPSADVAGGAGEVPA